MMPFWRENWCFKTNSLFLCNSLTGFQIKLGFSPTYMDHVHRKIKLSFCNGIVTLTCPRSVTGSSWVTSTSLDHQKTGIDLEVTSMICFCSMRPSTSWDSLNFPSKEENSPGETCRS